MRFVVTGSTGYLGSQLCSRLCNDGHDVIAVYRSPEKLGVLRDLDIETAKGDVTNRDFLFSAINNCDGCFHLAALASVWHKDPEMFGRINVEGTRNVLDAARVNNVPKVVFTSTASVFGPAQINSPATQECPPNFLADSLYEKSKVACESIVNQFVRDGLDVVTVYPTRVYGPGPKSESNALTKIFKSYLDGKWRYILGNGTHVGNYVHIQDCVDGHLRAMLQGGYGERYILGSENCSFRQLTDELNRAANRSTRFWRIPKPVLTLAATAHSVRAYLFNTKPAITHSAIRKYLRNWYSSSDKAKLQLDYDPRPLRTGIQQTIDWLVGNSDQ